VRIARVITRLNLGGPARQVLASDPLLAERGHEVRVFAGQPEPGEGDLFDEARARGIDVVRVEGLRRGLSPAKDLLVRRRLGKLLGVFAPDVVHTHTSKAGILGRWAAWKTTDAAVVHTFHGHALEGYFSAGVSRRLVGIERRLAKRTDRIVAVSHATGDDLLRLGVTDEESLVVVPPGIDLEPFLGIERNAALEVGHLRDRLGADRDTFLVGVVGRLAEVKQPALVLEVFCALAVRYPQLHVVFVGDGPERLALERGIAALDGDIPEGSGRVHMLGAVDDMLPVLKGLDAVLCASRSEGMPVALIEAAAASLPVVATSVGGVPEIVAHERTGFLGADVTELAFGLSELMGDPRACQGMGSRARLRVSSRHSASALADRLEALYKTVLEERRMGA